MAEPTFVQLDPQPLERYSGVLDGDFNHIREVAEYAVKAFEGRTVWHVNSTYLGGGVAEMLRSFLPYANDAGVDTRWVVLSEGPSSSASPSGSTTSSMGTPATAARSVRRNARPTSAFSKTAPTI